MKKFFLFALAALAFVACDDKRQSELTEDVLMKGTAKIAVQIRYSPGLHKVDGAYADVPLSLPAGATVFAKADYKQYSAEGKNIKQFPASLNSDGLYEVVIPAGEKAIEVQIVVNGFYGDYYANPDQATPDKAYYPKFESEKLKFTVLAGQEYVETDPQKTIIPAPAAALFPKQEYELASIKGKLQGSQEYWDKDAKSPLEVSPKMLGLKDKVVTLEIKAADPKKDPRVLQFKSSATNAEGAFEFKNIKIFDQWVDSLKADEKYLKVNLIVEPWTANFTHYYRVLSESNVKGLWKNEATYKAERGAKTDEQWFKDEKLNTYVWIDGDNNKYFYESASKQSEDVYGYWKAGKNDTTAIGDVKAAIVLFKSAEQDIEATFTPQDIKSISGIGKYSKDGKMVSVKLEDDKYIDMPEYSYNDPMKWDK